MIVTCYSQNNYKHHFKSTEGDDPGFLWFVKIDKWHVQFLSLVFFNYGEKYPFKIASLGPSNLIKPFPFQEGI